MGLNKHYENLTGGNSTLRVTDDGIVFERNGSGPARFATSDGKVTHFIGEGEHRVAGIENNNYQVAELYVPFYSGTSNTPGWQKFLEWGTPGTNEVVAGHLKLIKFADSTGNGTNLIDTLVTTGSEFDDTWGTTGTIHDSGTDWRLKVDDNDNTLLYLEVDFNESWDTGYLKFTQGSKNRLPNVVYDGGVQ